jgi:hypothetical protein
MTRRERHLRVIESMRLISEREEPRLRAKLGLAAYTDEAIEELTSMCVASLRFEQKIRRQNIARREAAERVLA